MNERKTCAITGSNGYVGGCVKNYFAERGWDILELTRQPKPNSRAVKFQLGEEIFPKDMAGVDALVHCAYDFKPLRWEEIRAVNVEGSRKLFQTAHAAKIPKIIFISSISAFDGCRSLYGKAKLETEKIALQNGALVLRPGLVFGSGPGGMFGKLSAQIKNSVVVPMIGDGSQIQFLVKDQDLANFVFCGAEGKFASMPVPVTVAHEQPWTFREILEKIARQQGRSVRFVPIPWWLVWMGIKGAEFCRIPMNFRSDSLISLIYQNPDPSFVGLKSLGFRCELFQ
jgi:nucleoside-diphosphate-sugar epimerase